MIKNIHPTQVISWITKIEKNLEKFDLYDEDTSKEEKLKYIRHQSSMLGVLEKVIEGRLYFVGTAQDIKNMDKREDG